MKIKLGTLLDIFGFVVVLIYIGLFNWKHVQPTWWLIDILLVNLLVDYATGVFRKKN